MTQEGVEDIDINFLDISDISDQTHQELDISEDFLASPLYRDIIYAIKNLQAPLQLTGTKARPTKLNPLGIVLLMDFYTRKTLEVFY